MNELNVTVFLISFFGGIAGSLTTFAFWSIWKFTNALIKDWLFRKNLNAIKINKRYD